MKFTYYTAFHVGKRGCYFCGEDLYNKEIVVLQNWEGGIDLHLCSGCFNRIKDGNLNPTVRPSHIELDGEKNRSSSGQ